MKGCLPILILLAGIGSSISFPQTASPRDPFARYMDGVKDARAEPSLRRFATECGVDVSNIQPRFAVGPGSSFAPVKNLVRGLRSVETDFYSTAEVWTVENRNLVEIWANSDDVGSEVRYYKCFESRKLMRADVVEWNLPAFQSPHAVAWGYSRRWERNASNRLSRTKAEFVDEFEQPIPRPTLDQEGVKSLRWMPPLGSLSELMLPPSTLR